MTIGNYSVMSIRNYVREVRFLFEYYPHVPPDAISQQQIEAYILYLKKTFNVGHAKCRSVAQSLSFFLTSAFIIAKK